MPERVTPEERLVSLAIEKARKAAEVLRQREPTQVKEVEHEAEEVKLKRPKAQADKTKIKTQSEETHSGYGLAGQEMKKAEKDPFVGSDGKPEGSMGPVTLTMPEWAFQTIFNRLYDEDMMTPGLKRALDAIRR